MKFLANLKGLFRVAFIVLDYLIWLIFDLSKFKKIPINKVRRILIIHLGAFGEILASTALISQIKKNLGVEIYYMVKGNRCEVLENNPDISRIMKYDDDMSNNIVNIKKNNLDLAMILWPGSTKLSLMCRKGGIKYVVGCFKSVSEGLGLFFDKRCFPIQKIHAVMGNANMSKLLGFNPKNPQMHYYLDDKSLVVANNYLKKNKIKRFAIIHPGFGGISSLKPNSRLWPTDRYAKIIDHLIEKYGLSVLITGMENELILAKSITSKIKNKKRVFVTNGSFNFKEQAALLSLSDLLIAPDTGIVHLASALNKKVIDLMSRTNPSIWHPWTNKKNYSLLFHPLNYTYFERFYDDSCGYECMKAITVAEVKNAIKKLIVD